MYVCMGKPSKYTNNKIELMELKLTRHHHQQQHQQQPQFGVITRARALALQRAQASTDTSSYLQLRSRRLQKLNRFNASKRKDNKKKKEEEEGNAESGNGSALAAAAAVAEGSCGENVLESQAEERSTREITPCSLIRNPDAVRTPDSSTRRTASADTEKMRNSSVIMPTTQQMNEFFAETENEDQRRFIEKYNFDVINDKPLPGRYEWEKVDP